MFTCSRNDALRRLAKAVSDYDHAECMVFTAQKGTLLDGGNNVESHVPADAPADLVQSTAVALNDAFRPMRDAIKSEALADMEAALAELREEAE